jgi:hypothetical protein|tara:strand:- start:14342 stop:14689 length:348 start_codon:yes stop_codon:yes gene_type:complete
MEEKKPKKLDGRRNNGAVKGISRGQGRPPKIKEKEMGALTLKALNKAFGSEEKAWIYVAEKASKGNFNYIKMLWEYRYGKPKEQQININKNVNIPIVDFGKPKTVDVDHKEIKDE